MDWDAKGAAGRMNGKEEYFQETACVCIICLGFLDSFGFYSRLALIESSLSYFVSDWRVTLHGKVNLAYQQNENIPLVFAEQCAAKRGGRKNTAPFYSCKNWGKGPKIEMLRILWSGIDSASNSVKIISRAWSYLSAIRFCSLSDIHSSYTHYKYWEIVFSYSLN